jgi:hypothetical protein
MHANLPAAKLLGRIISDVISSLKDTFGFNKKKDPCVRELARHQLLVAIH